MAQSLLFRHCVNKMVVDSPVFAKGATGHSLNIVGSQELIIELENRQELSHSFSLSSKDEGRGD